MATQFLRFLSANNRAIRVLFTNDKSHPERVAFEIHSPKYGRDTVVSALTGFEPGLRLVDNVDAAFATHYTAITMPVLERAE
jgi:hypothetical protein